MINTKKLEAYLSNTITSVEMKAFVSGCVNDYLAGTGCTRPEEFLSSLGLMKKDKKDLIKS